MAIIVSTLSNNKLHTKSITRIAKHLSAKLINHPGMSLSEQQITFGMPGHIDMQLFVQPDYYGYTGMG